jgi:hypothetical protein
VTAEATVFRAWSVAEPKIAPVDRLQWAMEMAREHFGKAMPPVIYVHPLTAAETQTPDGVELVPRPEVGRFSYWFPTNQERGA